MNIMLFLVPKSEVNYINDDMTLFKTLQTMQERNYEAVPIVSRTGKYIGTITPGDILGYIKENEDLTTRNSAEISIGTLRRVKDNKAVSVNCNIDDIVETLLTQNFVPVVDDNDHFIGIITRAGVFKWLNSEYKKLSQDYEEFK